MKGKYLKKKKVHQNTYILHIKKVFKTGNPKENMKREVSISIFAVLILAVSLLTVSYLRINPTGFAIFGQQAQADFNQGNYTNLTYNGSAVVLSANQTTGTYTSPIFDSGNTSTWNNMTTQGSNGLSFNVRSCSVSNCSDSNFTSANLGNLNLTGRYFQYKASFDSTNLTNSTLFLNSVSIDYSVMQQSQPIINTSVSISQPTGTKNSTSGIPIAFNAAGNNLSCSYNVQNSSGSVIGNISLTGCGNSSFNIAVNGNYTFNLYVSGSSGNAFGSSSFVVSLPSVQNTTQNTTTQTNNTQTTTQTNTTTTNQTTNTTTTPQLTQVTPQTLGVSISDIPGQNLYEDGTGTVTVQVQNTGTAGLSKCVLSSDSSEWVSVSSGSQSINAGAAASYNLALSVPKNSDLGGHGIGLTLTCSETTTTKKLTINVLQKKLDFNVTNVQRTSIGNIRVYYSLSELSNTTQNVTLTFDLLDSNKNIFSNITQNRTIGADKTGLFTANMPINGSLFNVSQNTSVTLKSEYSSSIFSGQFLKTIVLGAPTGGFLSGFAILGEGSGSIVAGVIVLLVIVIIFFVVRKIIRRNR